MMLALNQDAEGAGFGAGTRMEGASSTQNPPELQQFLELGSRSRIRDGVGTQKRVLLGVFAFS